MQRALDFDKTPALRVPLPFLLNVPLFALLAGALTTWAGPDIFASRWSAATLALTHLWTLGILGSAMLGALVQILAVACNVPIAQGPRIAGIVHALLTLGTLLLTTGLLWRVPTLLPIAATTLGMAFATYLAAVFTALWQARRQVYPGAREILVPVRLALGSLTLTVVLGLGLAVALGTGHDPSAWLDAHVLWGLVGWGGLLLMGMSFQLLPIFQLVELYPKAMTRWAPLCIALLLTAWTLAEQAGQTAWISREVTEFLLACVYGLWAAVTLQRLHARKRPTAEPTTLFWFTAGLSTLGCAALWLAAVGGTPAADMMTGIMLIIGVLGSAVNGMLYKIVPFLLWKHAQDAIVIPDDDPARVRAYLKVLPKMTAYLPTRRAQGQWLAHVAVLLSWTLAAAGWNPAMRVAGPLLVLSASLLGWNFWHALRVYRNALTALARPLPPPTDRPQRQPPAY